MFFSLFHVQLNILAEVLRFADREFYQVGFFLMENNFPLSCFKINHFSNPLLQGLVELQKSWWILEVVEPSRTLLVPKTRLQSLIEEGSEQDRFDADCFLYFSGRSRISCECINRALVFLGFPRDDDTSSDNDHTKIYGGCKNNFYFILIYVKKFGHELFSLN